MLPMPTRGLTAKRWLTTAAWAGTCYLFFCSAVTVADELSGEQTYRQRCAACHGEKAEGVADAHAQPLASDRMLEQLTRFIAKTMPQDAPGSLSTDEARRVAEYLETSFLAPRRAGDAAPRIELARLTVRQYRHAVAELLASLRHPGRWDDRRGLQGNYNAIDKDGNGKRAFERLDEAVKFDFGTSSPDPEKIDPMVFSISWSGSVLARESGDYEFLVRSENCFRLYVNDRVKPVIDAWIKSGDDKEYRTAIRLLGGRVYPLTLHYTKAGQGVRRPESAKVPVEPASIQLAWKRPGRLEETIGRECLSPVETPETLVVATSFPPDDRSTGFERGTSVTKEWDQATTDAAIEVAEYVRGRLKDFAAVPEYTSEHVPKIREFCARFAERGFRRPLSADDQARYIEVPFASTTDVETAVERVVLMVLKSPRFLYREVAGQPADPFNVASRLSFVLWDAPPDGELLAAAGGGKLSTPQEIESQARRMTLDPRFRVRLREFLWSWLKLDSARELNKDAGAFPDFNPQVAADLRTSLELALDEVITSDAADFRQLLLSDTMYLNGRLGRIYGVDLPADAPFQKVSMSAADRAGVLSHPYLLAVFADTKSSSPIRRGVFLARSVLGRALLLPPDAFVPLPPEVHPDLTTRERVSLQTGAEACRSCHGLINSLGFTLERYDALGRLRSEDHRKPIDASGMYVTRSGEENRFAGARELASYLAGSEETHAALVEKLFYFTSGQPIRAFGPPAHQQLVARFVAQDFNLRNLMIEIAGLVAAGPRNEQVSAITLERN